MYCVDACHNFKFDHLPNSSIRPPSPNKNAIKRYVKLFLCYAPADHLTPHRPPQTQRNLYRWHKSEERKGEKWVRQWETESGMYVCCCHIPSSTLLSPIMRLLPLLGGSRQMSPPPKEAVLAALCAQDAVTTILAQLQPHMPIGFRLGCPSCVHVL